jgi:uncharacterized membrane protein YfcA
MPDLELTPLIILAIAFIGLLAGLLGGMLGVGGSVIMIPGLVLLFGQGRKPGVDQHLYQAAAMIANVAVSIPAALRHHRAGATAVAAIRWILPAALVFVLVGVAASNLFTGRVGAIWLGRVLAILLVYVIAVNIRRLSASSQQREDAAEPRITPPRCLFVGGIMGAIAGLTGVGGGAIAVPLQQLALRLPLKSCIANSSAVICISAFVGSIHKNATLPGHGGDIRHSLLLAALLAPTCWLGARLGATLTHTLPVRTVRIAFIVLMIVAVIRMAEIGK